jgi:predicted nucleic acid-binding protein
MPHNLFLVDSSAWLFALRKEFYPIIKDRLDLLLKENRVLTTGIIKLELLGGTKTEKEFQRLKMRLDALEECQTDTSLWERAYDLAFQLRRKGVTIPYTDILIAACALSRDAIILHVDAHFDLATQYSDLIVESYVGKI